MEALRQWLLILSSFSTIPGLLYYSFSRNKDQVYVVIAFILGLSFLADNANYFFIRLIYPNSFIINNIWVILNYSLMVWLFGLFLDTSRKTTIYLLVTFFLGTILSFFYYSFLEPNTAIYLLSNLCFIALSLFTYFKLLQNPEQQLVNHPIFWTVTAFFIYYSLWLLQVVFNNYLIFDQMISSQAYDVIHIINLFANICKNFILFYVMVLIGKGYPATLKSAKVA